MIKKIKTTELQAKAIEEVRYLLEGDLADLPILRVVSAINNGYKVGGNFEVGDWVVNVFGEIFQLSEFQISNLDEIDNLMGIRHATEFEETEEKERRKNRKLDKILLDLSDDERHELHKKLKWG